MAKEPKCVMDVFQLIQAEAKKSAKAIDAKDDPEMMRIADASVAAVEAILKKYTLSPRDVALMLLGIGAVLEVDHRLHQEQNLKRRLKTKYMARNAAKAKHEKSGAGKAKNAVRQLWLDWRRKPNKYRSASAFARDMLDKYPDEIRNQQTVTRWCREWSAAQSAPNALPKDGDPCPQVKRL